MKNKKIIALFLVALLLVGGTFFWLLKKDNSSQSPTKTQQADGPTQEQLEQQAKEAAEQKQETIDKGSTATNPATQPSNSDISLTAQSESNGTATIFTKLTNASSGECQLTISNGSRTNSQTAKVIYQPEYSICAGFSVPISSIGAGTWTINLKVTSGSTTISKSITQEIR